MYIKKICGLLYVIVQRHEEEVNKSEFIIFPLLELFYYYSIMRTRIIRRQRRKNSMNKKKSKNRRRTRRGGAAFPPSLPRSQTQHVSGPITACSPMTSSTFWPDDEGCQVDTMVIKKIKPGAIIDRIGLDTGGYFARMDVSGKPYTYLKRSMKTYSSTRACKYEYDSSISNKTFNYNKYVVNDSAAGVNVLECNALFPEWINILVQKKHILEEDKHLYTGARQIIFLLSVDDDVELLKRWYGDWTDENDLHKKILDDRPQKILLDKPWTRFTPHDQSSIHIYNKDGKKWMVFTARGLITAGYITQISDGIYPEFIEPHKENILL
jgi:hypothetical protein